MVQKTVIIFGATGQLGGSTAKDLIDHGYHVIAVGHRASDNGFFAELGAEYVGGFSLEKAECFSLLAGKKADAVVHLAGTMPAHASALAMPYVQSIIVGMVNVCEWMKQEGIKRIIFNTTPSDVAHHFGKAVPVPEDADRSFPQDGGDHAVYAIAKSTAVDLLRVYQQAYGFQPCVFRHMTVYGWHPNADYFLNGERKVLPFRRIMRNCMKGIPVEIWGDPKRQKELLYVKDFTKAVRLAIESDVCGLFNLPGYRPFTLEEQIDGFIHAFCPEGKVSEKRYCPDKPDTPQNLLLLGGAKEKLNWIPEWDWERACQDMKQEMLANPMEKLWGKNNSEDCIENQ